MRIRGKEHGGVAETSRCQAGPAHAGGGRRRNGSGRSGPRRAAVRRPAVLVPVALLLLSGLPFAPSAAADDATVDCVLGGSPGPEYGDGPLVGDAPDETRVPVVTGCYNGRLGDDADADRFLLIPHRGNWLFEVRLLEGCAVFTYAAVGSPHGRTMDLCQGRTVRLGVIGGRWLEVDFEEGPATYFFMFE